MPKAKTPRSPHGSTKSNSTSLPRSASSISPSPFPDSVRALGPYSMSMSDTNTPTRLRACDASTINAGAGSHLVGPDHKPVLLRSRPRERKGGIRRFSSSGSVISNSHAAAAAANFIPPRKRTHPQGDLIFSVCACVCVRVRVLCS